MIRSWRNSKFIRNIITLAGGTAIAQVIPLLATPIISRIYDPSEMGVLGVYLAVISIVGIVSTLRYENAILIPKKDMDGLSLTLGAMLLVAASTLLTMAVVAILPDDRWRLLNTVDIAYDWILVPAGVLGMGLIQVLSMWVVRRNRFKVLAGSRILQSASSATTQVLFGIFGGGYIGLIIGQVIGQIAGCLALASNAVRWAIEKSPGVTILEIKKNIVDYKRFPVYSLPADVANVVTNYIPHILLGFYFGPFVVGLYAMAQRLLAAPLALIGNATLDVFKERAAIEYRDNGSCRRLCAKTMGALLLIGALPFMGVAVYGPELFGFVLGEQWVEAGVYAQLLSPLLMARFVVGPVSYVLLIAQKQDVDLIWQASLLVVSVIAIWLGGVLGEETYAILFFSLVYTIMYLVYGVVIYMYAKNPTESGRDDDYYH